MNPSVEILSDDEDDCSDNLYQSIVDSVNLMKEATADKIYQRLKKDDRKSYSKPQVDRALANALRYGIFEVHKNRYRLRDSRLDDEDAVHWQVRNDGEESPCRSENRNGNDYVDPEKDNRKFRKPSVTDNERCANCGRLKRKDQIKTASAKSGVPSKSFRLAELPENVPEKSGGRKNASRKRKTTTRSASGKSSEKVRKMSGSNLRANNGNLRSAGTARKPKTQPKRNIIHYPEWDSPSEDGPSSDDETYKSRRYNFRYDYSEEKDDTSAVDITRTNNSRRIVADKADDERKEDEEKNVEYDQPSTSKSLTCKERSAAEDKTDPKVYRKSERGDQKSDWLENPTNLVEGTVKQASNGLTIQPMDSLPYKNHETTSYIS